MVSYSLSGIPTDVWESFKRQVPRTRNLEAAVIERLAAEEIGERTADDQGRVRVGTDRAGEDLRVFILPAED